MATRFKCDYCAATFDNNATLVHTERQHGLWELEYSMCPDCFKHFKVMLEKAKSQKSWTRWAALEKEVTSLKKETKSLKSELQFLRQRDPTCDQLMTGDPHNELVTVATKGGEKLMAHRSILMSRSTIFKTVLTSDNFKKQTRKHNESAMINLDLPTHPDSFRAFIQFLYAAELKPEILKKHAPELMAAGHAYEMGMLTHKCEDYMLHNMTDESTIEYLEVGQQCNSEVIIAAAVKRIQSNGAGFLNREDFKALEKKNPTVLAKAFQYVMGKEKEKKPKGSDHASVPGSDPSVNSGLPRDHRYEANCSGSLGTCTCSVHPFAHSAAPGFEYHGVHFNAATAMPSTVYYVDPALVPNK